MYVPSVVVEVVEDVIGVLPIANNDWHSEA
jgi:hypothetical protein